MVETGTPLAAALSYAELGWPVVPLFTPINGVCDCPDTYKQKQKCAPGKHPRTMHGLDDATTDPEKIARWWAMWPHANVAIDLVRSGLLDIAPDSLQWQAEFIARGLPWTASFRSGGGDGHEHHLYRRPPECPAYRLCKTDEYDILSAGYAVMPPSLHESGQHYIWKQPPDILGVTDAPGWAVATMQDVVRSSHVHLNGQVPEEADEAPVALAGEDLERWNGHVVPIKHDGSIDRSAALFHIGLSLAKAGASRSAIRRALHDRDETLGWSKYVGRTDAVKRYDVIAQRAIEGKPSPRLVVPPADPQASESDEAYQFVVRSASEFLALDLPKIEWLIPGILREQGIVGNFGGPGSLKTYFSTQLALCVALGPPRVFLEFDVRRAKVLIVQEDTPESDYQQVYLRPMVKAMNISPSDLDGWLYVATSNDFLLDDQSRLEALDSWMTEHKPELLVLDAFFLLHQGEGMTARDLGPVLRTLKRLRKKHRCAIWIVDHNRKQPGKGDEADLIDRWYGGRPKSAATDGAIEAHALSGFDDVVEFKVVKMRGGQKLLPAFHVQIRDGVLYPFTTSNALSDSISKVYDWLLMQHVSKTVRDIEDGTKLKERTVRDTIKGLVDRGWIMPGEMLGKPPHQQKTWLAVRVAGSGPEIDDGEI